MTNMNAKRVFFIGIDGVGNYIKEANTPNIDKILYGGSYSYEAATVVPTISGECWGSLFHGVGPIDHLLTNDIVSNNKFDLSLPYPSFIKKIREAHPEKDVSSFVVWNPINTGILEEDIHMVKEKAADDKVAGLMINRIREKKEDIVYSQVVFDMVDHAGHASGYGSLNYLKAIEAVDVYVGEILDAIKAEGLMEDSMIFVTTDHGGGGSNPTSHGSARPKDRIIFFGCCGNGIKVNNEIQEQVSIMDMAPTVLKGLNIAIPEVWQGKALDVFE